MLVKNQKMLNLGLVLAISFFGVLLLIFSPVFDGKNGLEYSDSLFNKLAKGSSYFVPEIKESLKAVQGVDLGGTKIKMENADAATRAATLLTRAKCGVQVNSASLTITGNLAGVLEMVLDDSSAMYYNNGAEVSAKYGMDEKEVMTTWWGVLNRVAKEFQKGRKAEEANVIIETMKKGIEPAFNFYKIEPQKVSEKAVTLMGMLFFYVLYTMWWGFAIYYLFDGLGLSMKKARVKQEV
jgi:hypothetical protein